MRNSVASAVLCAIALTAATSSAEPGGGFGKAGQISIGTGSALFFGRVKVTPPRGESTSDTVLSIAGLLGGAATGGGVQGPAITGHYFVTDGFSAGLSLSYGIDKPKDHDAVSLLAVGPVLGYAVALGESFSLWPQAGLRYNRYTSTQTTLESGSSGFNTSSKTVTGHRLNLAVDVPVVMHITQHFYFGVGPHFNADLVSQYDGEDDDKLTVFGVAGQFGGWF